MREEIQSKINEIAFMNTSDIDKLKRAIAVSDIEKEERAALVDADRESQRQVCKQWRDQSGGVVAVIKTGHKAIKIGNGYRVELNGKTIGHAHDMRGCKEIVWVYATGRDQGKWITEKDGEFFISERMELEYE